MRGRKPTPTVLKLVHGNPGKRKIPDNLFTPKAQKPSCPRHIKGVARKEWNRITKILSGVITDADRGALAMLCVNWAHHVEAIEQMQKLVDAGGPTALLVKSPSGYPMQSPWLSIANRSQEMYAKLCTEFGLTPSSRTRVAMNPGNNKPQPNSSWGQFKKES